MKVLIRQATILCSSSPFNGQVKDILIVDGRISRISDTISESVDETITQNNIHVSAGWMDVFAHFAEPGFEHKETLESGSAAAAAGGFTDVMIIPNTQPAISSKSQVEYILQKSASLPVNIYPIATITKNAEGKELSEMYDMHASGAIAFSDGKNPVQSPGLLLKALQYISSIKGTIIQIPRDRSIGEKGLMNEGIISTRIGLPGIPAIAEELMIARDIELLKYTHSNLHITGVSTKKGIDLITTAKKDGLGISCSATPYHCFFNDEDLSQYDTNLKVHPPLRKKEDMLAIRKAVAEGLVDCIASHHFPEHWDDKTCEFEYAKNGMIGLESLFGAMNNNTQTLIEQLTINPRKIFGLQPVFIEEGSKACLTIFDPDQSYIFDAKMIRSKSRNSPFIGKQLKGKVIGIINENFIVLN
ncbi:MAG: dihydroorotase [Ferruginibacter sp.]